MRQSLFSPAEVFFKKGSMANSSDQDQNDIGAVCPGSTLIASILNVSNVRQLFAADDFSRHLRCIFFLA